MTQTVIDLRALAERFVTIRAATTELARPLEPEDTAIQSMPDASPTKWHLAHTSWFFETFVLTPHLPGYEAFHPAYAILFNSYYNAIGPQWSRPARGLLSRPTLGQVRDYRAHVDAAMADLLEDPPATPALAGTIEVGLQHEQQHQELILTDLKHLLASNPLRPVYRERPTQPAGAAVPPLTWRAFTGGLRSIGHDGPAFAFDNERPRHEVFLRPFELAHRLVTCGEWIEFVDDGGYRRPELWLSDGWARVQEDGWALPLYWEKLDDGAGFGAFTLAGFRPIDPAEPVSHVSHFEADAYARWAGARLPTEQEWETAVRDVPIAGNFVESGRLHPAPLGDERGADAPPPGDGLAQAYGDVWEWTASPYVGYPGYRTPDGAIGEYNGKFMSNQMVLRGGSWASPRSHLRATYRNFFPSAARWQATGLRLARDAH